MAAWRCRRISPPLPPYKREQCSVSVKPLPTQRYSWGNKIRGCIQRHWKWAIALHQPWLTVTNADLIMHHFSHQCCNGTKNEGRATWLPSWHLSGELIHWKSLEEVFKYYLFNLQVYFKCSLNKHVCFLQEDLHVNLEKHGLNTRFSASRQVTVKDGRWHLKTGVYRSLGGRVIGKCAVVWAY